MNKGHVAKEAELKQSGIVERRVICAAITEFFESMISEFSGTDDGCNVTLDDYTIEKGLRPYFEYYIKNKINI